MKKFLFIILLLIGVIHEGLSQEVRFFASTDAEQVIEGGYFNVIFTLENARGSSFRAPSFLPFTVEGGPNQSSQMTIINGKTSQKMSFGYTLSISTAGEYEIGSATVNVNNKTYRTEPITVTVVKSTNKTSPTRATATEGSEDAFILTEIDNDTAYIGQQLTLKYVLYTSLDVRSYNFIELPDFDGFYAEEIQNYSERPVRVVRNGKQYLKRVLKVFSLFPQQKGYFPVASAVVNIGVARRGSRSSFFFNSNLKPMRLASDDIKLYVVNLPADPPLSFSGAVGEFLLGSAVDKRSITMDDALTLTLQIRGDGDNKFIEAPDQPLQQYFDIYDPNLQKEETAVVGDKIHITKTYEYLMIPKQSGSIEFKPELTYYSLDSQSYVTLHGQTYAVNILSQTARDVAVFDGSDQELEPIAETIGKTKVIGTSFINSLPFLAVNASYAFLFIVMLVVRGVRVKKSNMDPAIKRRTRAQKVALTTLRQAEKELQAENIQQFYIELRKAFVEYLSNKLNLSKTQLTKDEISHILLANGLEESTPQLIEIMEKGEKAIYASTTDGKEKELFSNAMELIERFEAVLKK